jgi:RimJ/RimL family protein N-acetyltransferase
MNQLLLALECGRQRQYTTSSDRRSRALWRRVCAAAAQDHARRPRYDVGHEVRARAIAAVMNVIRCARLELRELTLQDDEFILRLLNEAAFLRFIGDKGVRTLSDARDYIVQGPMESYRRFGFGLYLTSLLDGGSPIGVCGLVKRDTLADIDIGFAFLSRYWSHGYASESAAAVLAYGEQQLKLRRIVAITAPDNHASIAVLERIGLRFERMIKLSEHGPELKMFGPASSARAEPS